MPDSSPAMSSLTITDDESCVSNLPSKECQHMQSLVENEGWRELR